AGPVLPRELRQDDQQQQHGQGVALPAPFPLVRQGCQAAPEVAERKDHRSRTLRVAAGRRRAMLHGSLLGCGWLCSSTITKRGSVSTSRTPRPYGRTLRKPYPVLEPPLAHEWGSRRPPPAIRGPHLRLPAAGHAA